MHSDLKKGTVTGLTRRLEGFADLIVKPSASIRSAMESLESSARRIVLVCDDEGRLMGTITDGDLRRALLSGASLDQSHVVGVMTRAFRAVDPGVSRAEVLDLMRALRLNQVPVVDHEGRLVGLHTLEELMGEGTLPNWAVVMAGGKGTRLRPLTADVPKPMLRVAGRPILERIVLHLVGMGIRRIFLSVHFRPQVVVDHFGDGTRFGCRIEYLRENLPLGTAGALGLLPEPPSDPLLVMNGDLVTQFQVRAMLRQHTECGNTLTVGVRPYEVRVPFGVVAQEDGFVQAIQEKPAETFLVNAGIYVLSPGVLGRLDGTRPVDMPELVQEELEGSNRVGAFEVDGEWIDVGRTDDLKRARGVG